MPIITFPNRNVYGDYDTTTHVSVPNPDFDHDDTYTINVKVRMERGWYSWSCPNADVMRRQVDDALKGTGYRRVGRRDYRHDGPITDWWYVYSVERI